MRGMSVSEIYGKAKYAAWMVRQHPGVAENPARFALRLAGWRVLTALGRDSTVAFPTYGVQFWCPPEWRGMSKMAYTLREHYEPELLRLQDWVRPGGTVIDIGAHYGAYTIALSALVGPEGRVFAVEPADHALSVLRRNIEINASDNVAVLATALGDTPATAMLHLHGDQSRASLNQFAEGDTGSQSVAVARLDDLVHGGPVTFIKIDVEGYELPALRGAERILSEDRPVVQFELQPGAATRGGLPPFGVWDLLRSHGYRFQRLQFDGTYVPVLSCEDPGGPNLIALPG
jgi:FkbM family methyltransferase